MTISVHAGLIWIFLERPPAQPATADVVFVEAAVLPRASNVAPTAAIAEAAKPASADSLPPQPTAPLTSSAETPARGLRDLGPTSQERFGYMPSDEVDQAATPIGDWTVDTELLPRGTTLKVIVRLWISAAGLVDAWELVGSTGNDALARRALHDLARTPIQPAFRDHVAVASVSQIELMLQHE